MIQTPNLSDLYHSLVNDITHHTSQLTLLNFVASKINRKAGQIFLLFLIFTSILTSVGFLGHYFTVFLALVLALPRTIQMQQKNSKDQRDRYNTYWLVVGAIVALHYVFGGLLVVLPFYDLAKLLLVVSMSYPKTDLAGRIFHKGIEERLLGVVRKEEVKVE